MLKALSQQEPVDGDQEREKLIQGDLIRYTKTCLGVIVVAMLIDKERSIEELEWHLLLVTQPLD